MLLNPLYLYTKCLCHLTKYLGQLIHRLCPLVQLICLFVKTRCLTISAKAYIEIPCHDYPITMNTEQCKTTTEPMYFVRQQTYYYSA